MNRKRMMALAIPATAGAFCVVASLLVAGGRLQAKPVQDQAQDSRNLTFKPGDDKYVDAQASMRKARELLRDYLATNPSGPHAYFAKRQLKSLGASIPTDEIPLPVGIKGDITWRILLVECHEGYTKVTFEFNNTNPKQNQGFDQFDANPLVIVANNHLYAMKKQGFVLPQGITQGDYNQWVVQADVTGKIDVNFEPFDETVTSGTIRYSRGGEGVEFNMMNVKQIPAL